MNVVYQRRLMDGGNMQGQWKSCVEIVETIGERNCSSVMVE